MTPEEHREAADRLLTFATRKRPVGAKGPDLETLAVAQVHATLATYRPPRRTFRARLREWWRSTAPGVQTP